MDQLHSIDLFCDNLFKFITSINLQNLVINCHYDKNTPHLKDAVRRLNWV